MANLLHRSLQAAGAGLRAGWLILGITLLLIVLGEAGLRLALTTRDRLMVQPPTIDKPVPADAHRGAAWTAEYDQEQRAAMQFVSRPYVSWRGLPYQGRYIAVDRNGRRVTWNPPTRDPADPPTVRVVTFGASTLWGAGVRNDHTLASYLSKLLHAKGYPAEVTNDGQLAYVSTQEAITLLRGIHRGEIPDIVLFYDGLSDIYASYQQGAAGIPWNEQRWRVEPNALEWSEQWLWTYGEKGLWGFHHFVNGLRRRFATTGLQRRIRSRPLGKWLHTGPLRDEVARQTLRVYAANLAFVESLGRRYGFEPLFYWQPGIFSKRRPSPGEQTAVAGWSPNKKKVIDETYRRVRQSEALNDNPRFHDISALFDDLEGPYYVDTIHLSESGNRLVAAAMVEDVIALIEQRRAANPDKQPPRSVRPF